MPEVTFNGKARFISSILATLVSVVALIGILWSVTLKPQVRDIAREQAELSADREHTERVASEVRVERSLERIETKLNSVQQYLLENPR